MSKYSPLYEQIFDEMMANSKDKDRTTELMLSLIEEIKADLDKKSIT